MVMHTHSYREPSPFAGQRVVVVGASASGEDISREIARVAKKVLHIAWARDRGSVSMLIGAMPPTQVE